MVLYICILKFFFDSLTYAYIVLVLGMCFFRISSSSKLISTKDSLEEDCGGARYLLLPAKYVDRHK